MTVMEEGTFMEEATVELTVVFQKTVKRLKKNDKQYNCIWKRNYRSELY